MKKTILVSFLAVLFLFVACENKESNNQATPASKQGPGEKNPRKEGPEHQQPTPEQKTQIQAKMEYVKTLKLAQSPTDRSFHIVAAEIEHSELAEKNVRMFKLSIMDKDVKEVIELRGQYPMNLEKFDFNISSQNKSYTLRTDGVKSEIAYSAQVHCVDSGCSDYTLLVTRSDKGNAKSRSRLITSLESDRLALFAVNSEDNSDLSSYKVMDSLAKEMADRKKNQPFQCELDQVKAILEIPHETVGLNNMGQIGVIIDVYGCDKSEDGVLAQAFLEVTGETLKDFEGRVGSESGEPTTVVGGKVFSWSQLTTEAELILETEQYEIVNEEIEVIQIDLSYEEMQVMEADIDNALLEITLASDKENQGRLQTFSQGFQLSEEGTIAKIENTNSNWYCIKQTRNTDFRMAGICLVDAIVRLPKGSDLLVLDKDGLRVNESDLPMSKAEFFATLKAVSFDDRMAVVDQYVKYRKPTELLSDSDILSVLKTVSIDNEVEALQKLYPAIEKPLYMSLVMALLDEVSINEELNVLRFVQNDIETPISPLEVQQVLSELPRIGELEGFKILAPKVAVSRRGELHQVIDNELSRNDREEARQHLQGL